MPMTPEEITACENQLLDTIAESKRLLAAYRVIRADGKKSLPVSRDPAARVAREIDFQPETAAPTVQLPVAVPVPLEANLAVLSKGYGGGIRVVTWAIRQLPGDFGVREIAAVLQQAGYPLRGPQLSVILNRMKDARKIIEVWKGRGRRPSLFRATADLIAIPLRAPPRATAHIGIGRGFTPRPAGRTTSSVGGKTAAATAIERLPPPADGGTPQRRI